MGTDCLLTANDEGRIRNAMDTLKLERYCCRRMVMTHVDLIEKLLRCVTVPYIASLIHYEWNAFRFLYTRSTENVGVVLEANLPCEIDTILQRRKCSRFMSSR